MTAWVKFGSARSNKIQCSTVFQPGRDLCVDESLLLLSVTFMHSDYCATNPDSTVLYEVYHHTIKRLNISFSEPAADLEYISSWICYPAYQPGTLRSHLASLMHLCDFWMFTISCPQEKQCIVQSMKDAINRWMASYLKDVRAQTLSEENAINDQFCRRQSPQITYQCLLPARLQYY